ncbi:MAG: hypothetical protein AB1384_03485 [Actinomycetota bacterium]
MLMLSTVTFPATSAAEFVKKAIEELTNNPYPEFTKRDYYFKFSGEGLVMYIIYDIAAGNEEAALRDINERIFKFSNAIDGFKPTLEPLIGFEDAFSLINMTAPEQ